MDLKTANPSDDRSPHRIQVNSSPLAEFTANVLVWQPARLAAGKKLKKKDKRPDSASPLNPPTAGDDARRLRERSSWLSIPRGSSSSISQGQWIPAKCCLSEFEGSKCELSVYDEQEPGLLYAVSIHQLLHTEIRQAHKSLFFCPNVITIHPKHGKASGLLAGGGEQHLAGNTASSGGPPALPAIATHASSLSQHHLPNASFPGASPGSTPSSPSPSLHIRFPTVDLYNTWLLLLRTFSQPETYGTKLLSEPERSTIGGLYRMWRGIEMEVMEGRGLLNSAGSGVGGWSDKDILASVLSPQSGPQASGETRDALSPPGSSSGSLLNPSGAGLPTPLSSHNLTSSHFASTSGGSEYDVFCEVYVDTALFGRTTSKRTLHTSAGDASAPGGKSSLRPHGSSHGSAKESSVIWHESMRFPDVGPHGTLSLSIYKVRPSSHSQLSPSSSAALPSSMMNMSHPSSVSPPGQHVNHPQSHQNPAHQLGKSISGGVALIGQAAVGGVSKFHGHKEREREPVLIGTVEIALANFRRGEWVEGWWSIIPAAGNEGRIGVAEVKLKVKVDEEIVLPSKAYSSLSSIITSQNPLDLISATSGPHTNGEASQRAQGGRARTAPASLDSQPPPPPLQPQQSPPLVFDHVHHTHIAHHLHIIGAFNHTLVPSILPMLQAEINTIAASPQGTNTLFRGNTMLTKTIEFAMHFYGKQWLESSVGPVVRRFCNERVLIEVDISKLKGGKKHLMREGIHEKGGKISSTSAGSAGGETILGVAKELDANVKTLVKWCNEFWDSIWNARGECPNELRTIFQHVRTLVDARWGSMMALSNRSTSSVSSTSVNSTDSSDDDRPLRQRERGRDLYNLRFQSISAFVFLRLIVPAILTPHLFGLVDGFPPTYVQRGLRSIAKVIQSLANLNMTVHQEEHMRPVKDFLHDQYDGMIDYLLHVSNLAPVPLPTPLSGSPSFSTGVRDARDGNRSFRSLDRNYSTDRSFTSYTHSLSSSEYSSPPNHRSNVGPGFDHQATVAYIQQRTSRLPVLHRESIPTLPHIIDVSKHLAILSSTVVRNAKGARKNVGYSAHVLTSAAKVTSSNALANATGGADPASTNEASDTRVVLGAEARPEDFQMVCFEIHAEALGCVTKLMPSRTRKKSHTIERPRPNTADQLQQYPTPRQRSISQPRAMSANAETRPTFIDPRMEPVPINPHPSAYAPPSPNLPPGSRSYGESRGYPVGKISISTMASKTPASRSTSSHAPSSPSHLSPSASSFSSRYPATDSPTASTTVFSPVSPTGMSRRGAENSSGNSSGGETHISLERAIEMGPALASMATGTIGSTTRRQRGTRPATAPSTTAPGGPSSESSTSTDSFSKRRYQESGPSLKPLRIPQGRVGSTSGSRDRDLPAVPDNPSFTQTPRGIPEPNLIPPSLPTTPVDSSGQHHHQYRQPRSGSRTPQEIKTPSSSSDERKHEELLPPNVLGKSGLSRPASNPAIAHAYNMAADPGEDASGKKRKGFFRGLLSSKNR